MKICKQCGKKYKNIYVNQKSNSIYTIPTEFCSKSCKTIYQRGSLTKEKIEQEIVNFILVQNKYCTQTDVLKGINRSSKTLNKFNISITGIQKVLGFTKPKSVFQEKIYSYLITKYDNIICEKTFDSLVSPKGFKLFVDFYVPSINTIIEADGTQHYDENNPWYSDYNKLCDNIKNNFALNSNINIIRIPYTKNVSHIYLKQYI